MPFAQLLQQFTAARRVVGNAVAELDVEFTTRRVVQQVVVIDHAIDAGRGQSRTRRAQFDGRRRDAGIAVLDFAEVLQQHGFAGQLPDVAVERIGLVHVTGPEDAAGCVKYVASHVHDAIGRPAISYSRYRSGYNGNHRAPAVRAHA